jgi:dephospho-CoA kinase
VGNPTKKPLIGVIGGIASGKSTVAAEFGKLGCAVIDADAIAHESLREAPVREEVVRLFGPGVVNSRGEVDRRRLASVAFADERRLSALNHVIHPHVLQRTEELIAQYNKESDIPAIVLDMPLLIEVGWADRCDRVIFVACDRARRAERARRKGLLDEMDIEIRENSQISLDKKAELADNIIDNNSDFSTLVRQIQDIFSDIIKFW